MSASVVSSDRKAFRIAGAAAIAGAVIAVPAQLLHPMPDPDVERAFLTEVNESGIWILVHLMALVAYSMGPLIFFGLYRSIVGESARIVAAIGYVFVVIGTALTVSWTVIDGVAMKHIVDDYYASSGAAQEAAFPAADAVEHVILAFWSMSWVAWFGVPWILFGVALAISESWPRWLGWAGVGTGAFAGAVGIAQLYTERTLVTSGILFPASGALASIWVAVIGVLLWRRASALDRAPVAQHVTTSTS